MMPVTPITPKGSANMKLTRLWSNVATRFRRWREERRTLADLARLDERSRAELAVIASLRGCERRALAALTAPNRDAWPRSARGLRSNLR